MTRQELETRIRRASDIMRADDNTKLVTKYIEHLSWLLFLRAFEAIEDEQEVLDSEYRRVLDGAYRWSVWATKDWNAEELLAFVNEDLVPHLRSLSGSRPAEQVATIFNGVTTVMKSGYSLKEVVALVDEIDFHSVDDVHTISLIYESLLSKFGSEAGWSGEFYTPRPLVKFMVHVVRPSIGDTVYDPAAGSAGFLVEAFEFMRGHEQTLEEHRRLQEETFFGQESGELAFLLGIMNMILHGVRSPNVLRANTLEQDVRTISPAEQHDVILTNPPFGGRENPQIQQNFPIPVQATELLFLQHVMRKLKTNGRCGIVLPEGVLFRRDAFARVKQDLVDNYGLWGIVSLPGGVFAPYSGVKTNLVFFDRSARPQAIWYYELLPPPGQRFTKTNPIQDAHLEDALTKIHERQESDQSWSVPVESVKGDYDLTAKNPRANHDVRFRPPSEVIGSILEKEREVISLLEEVNDLLD